MEQLPLTLWYSSEAADWMKSALPIGNGTLGGMFFGGVERERMQFNEKTLWTGGPESRGSYQNFGDVYLNFSAPHAVTDYRRELSLDNAVGSVSYTADGVSYLREYFASFPDQVIVMRLTTPGSTGKLHFSVELSDGRAGGQIIENNGINIRGKLDILSYEARLAVLCEGGSIRAGNDRIYIENANAVTILLAGGTNYAIENDTYVGETAEELHTRMVRIITAASAKSPDELRQNHLNDYRALFNRVTLDLRTGMPDIPTDELIESRSKGTYLDILYFQYGRYLMIASSRGMNLPSNLQGIWNHSNEPPWQCDIHTNINIQMNYWLAEPLNLSECHLPFLNYVAIEALRKNGTWRQMAASLGNPGWALKTQTDIFAYTDWNWNRPANAWYCMHLWEHYAYTNDTVFLRGTAFPVMKSACEFWLDRLILNAEGKWEAPDEWSPEQGDWENGIAYAQQLIWELFDQTLKAAAVLETRDDFTGRLQETFARLDNGVAVGSWGQIREWKYDVHNLDNDTNRHRHQSHLIALYPGNQISPLAGERYAEAAKVTLNARGDAGTGWSRAWKITFWARLFDGEHAYRLLKAALDRATVMRISIENGDGGVYDNLLCAHPPFQIDGNFGAAAGIAEMLLQSNRGCTHLLPALPAAWANGSFSGLRARGNFTVDLAWEESRPVMCKVYSGSGNVCSLYCPGVTIAGITSANEQTVDCTVNGNTVIFVTESGGEYYIQFGK